MQMVELGRGDHLGRKDDRLSFGYIEFEVSILTFFFY